jgi:hypothetical protein
MEDFKLTDMTDSSLIPQLVEQLSHRVQKEQERVFIETCFRFDIDPDILINQTKEIHRLNGLLRKYAEGKKPNVIDDWNCLCPSCDMDLEITLEDLECGCFPPNYCKDCGQKLNWSELEGSDCL